MSVLIVAVMIPGMPGIGPVMTGIRWGWTVMVGTRLGGAVMVAMTLSRHDAHRRGQCDDSDRTE